MHVTREFSVTEFVANPCTFVAAAFLLITLATAFQQHRLHAGWTLAGVTQVVARMRARVVLLVAYGPAAPVLGIATTWLRRQFTTVASH